ncbi:hypothetical protein CDAR_269621 [Caerostris darwini]|uniref:Uncharacterized protein n=1 Tax=Caerostris darwini TaxID=1538125 RepID=A0AAV4SJ92_9ARAC|nr:hypothetical protein CDAR_269621 [Caerostris darwini]
MNATPVTCEIPDARFPIQTFNYGGIRRGTLNGFNLKGGFRLESHSCLSSKCAWAVLLNGLGRFTYSSGAI